MNPELSLKEFQGRTRSNPQEEMAISKIDARKILCLLSDSDFLIFYLIYYCEFPQEIVAKFLNISRKTIYRRIKRFLFLGQFAIEKKLSLLRK